MLTDGNGVQFSKIFVIGMAERVDKRDSIELAASVSDLDLTWVDGVVASSMPNKSMPLGWDTSEPDGSLGCWRAHMVR